MKKLDGKTIWDKTQPATRISELPAVFDVDDTLIAAPDSHEKYLVLDYYGVERLCRPVEQHIEFLKACHKRGYEITVWSANGFKWAEEVVNKLGLNDYVHYVATKPLIYVDDKDANDWMKRVFISN